MEKTINELIIDTLLTGEALMTDEVHSKVSETGKEVDLTSISSIFSVLSNKDKCNLGYFLLREKNALGYYTYSFVKEALNLLPVQLYGLTRKIGEKSVSLDEAVEKVPSLKNYINPSMKGRRNSRRSDKDVGNNMKEIIAEVFKEVIFQGGINMNINCCIKVEIDKSPKG